MKILKILLTITAAVIAAFMLFLGIFTAIEYKPAQETALEPLTENPAEDAAPQALHLLSWNIGYCGLDSQTDFFLEGGSQKGRIPAERQQENLENVIRFIQTENPDICFLQETDRPSFRSCNVDQAKKLAEIFNSYSAFHAQNYKCAFVPMPVSAPIGKVNSGLLSMSRYQTDSNTRIQLPGSFSWPTRIFHLKRCVLMSRIPSPVEGKSWYLLNVHLSAYDNGSMRKQQLDFLKDLMLSLYNEGHYVIAGGDWNSQFPGITNNSFGTYTTPQESLFWLQKLPEGWKPAGWQWAYKTDIPTSRTLEKPYKKGENFTTVIDGFLISPNLQIEEVQGFDLEFRNSDHNPVSVKVKIQS